MGSKSRKWKALVKNVSVFVTMEATAVRKTPIAPSLSISAIEWWIFGKNARVTTGVTFTFWAASNPIKGSSSSSTKGLSWPAGYLGRAGTTGKDNALLGSTTGAVMRAPAYWWSETPVTFKGLAMHTTTTIFKKMLMMVRKVVVVVLRVRYFVFMVFMVCIFWCIRKYDSSDFGRVFFCLNGQRNSESHTSGIKVSCWSKIQPIPFLFAPTYQRCPSPLCAVSLWINLEEKMS